MNEYKSYSEASATATSSATATASGSATSSGSATATATATSILSQENADQIAYETAISIANEIALLTANSNAKTNAYNNALEEVKKQLFSKDDYYLLNPQIFFQTILEYKIYNNLKASFGNDYLEFFANNNLYNEYLENQKRGFFQSTNSSPKFILSLWISNIVKNSIHLFNNNISFDIQLTDMYSKLYDVYKKNIEKLYFLTSDYIIGFFYKIDKLTYDEMTILLEYR